MTKYEKTVIEPIMKVIENNQVFLTKHENLPQLAKLGFMFERLYYAGRICYGYDGIVKRGSSCENNPKDIIGNIKYENKTIEELVYDAWGMHVENEISKPINHDMFVKFILEENEISEFQLMLRKKDKTFDEWVEVLTNKEYRYRSLYPNRKSVAENLLCVIGTEYGYNKKTGFIIKEAGGAEQDESSYGQWENAKFSPEIESVVLKVLNSSEFKSAINAEYDYLVEIIRQKKEKERKDRMESFGSILDDVNTERVKNGSEPIDLDSDEFHTAVSEYLDMRMSQLMSTSKKAKNKNGEDVEIVSYYPISEYSNITKFDSNTHPSYIKAAIEVCEDIVRQPDVEDGDVAKNNASNKKFAKKFLRKYKVEQILS